MNTNRTVASLASLSDVRSLTCDGKKTKHTKQNMKTLKFIIAAVLLALPVMSAQACTCGGKEKCTACCGDKCKDCEKDCCKKK